MKHPVDALKDLLEEFRADLLPREAGEPAAPAAEGRTPRMHGASVAGAWFQGQQAQMRDNYAGVTVAGVVLAQDDTHIDQKQHTLCPCTVSVINIPDHLRVGRAWRRIAFAPRVDYISSPD